MIKSFSVLMLLVAGIFMCLALCDRNWKYSLAFAGQCFLWAYLVIAHAP